MFKKQVPNKPKSSNKGKKYEKPLSLYGMKVEQLIDIGLKFDKVK